MSKAFFIPRQMIVEQIRPSVRQFTPNTLMLHFIWTLTFPLKADEQQAKTIESSTSLCSRVMCNRSEESAHFLQQPPVGV